MHKSRPVDGKEADRLSGRSRGWGMARRACYIAGRKQSKANMENAEPEKRSVGSANVGAHKVVGNGYEMPGWVCTRVFGAGVPFRGGCGESERVVVSVDL